MQIPRALPSAGVANIPNSKEYTFHSLLKIIRTQCRLHVPGVIFLHQYPGFIYSPEISVPWFSSVCVVLCRWTFCHRQRYTTVAELSSLTVCVNLADQQTTNSASEVSSFTQTAFSMIDQWANMKTQSILFFPEDCLFFLQRFSHRIMQLPLTALHTDSHVAEKSPFSTWCNVQKVTLSGYCTAPSNKQLPPFLLFS